MADGSVYDLTCTRSGEWWIVEVPAQPGVRTRARRLDQAPAEARAALARELGLSAEEAQQLSVEMGQVRLAPEAELLPIEREIGTFLTARQDVEEAQAWLSAEARRLAAGLVGSGLTLRDAGALLGVSHQRVAQLLADEA